MLEQTFFCKRPLDTTYGPLVSLVRIVLFASSVPGNLLAESAFGNSDLLCYDFLLMSDNQQRANLISFVSVKSHR